MSKDDLKYLKIGQTELSKKSNKDEIIQQNYNHPTSYGGLAKDDSIKRHLNQACLGSLAFNGYGNKLKAFWIWHQIIGDKKADKAWMKWLLDPKKSPWKEIVKVQPEQDFDFILENGYVLTNLDFPANFFVNFLTAFRMSYEKHNLIQIWHELVESDVSPGAALSVVSLCQYGDTPLQQRKKDGLIALYTNDYCQGHWPVDSWYGDLKVAARLNESEPLKNRFLEHDFRNNANYSPCNIIWDGNDGRGSKSAFYEAFWRFLETKGNFKKPSDFKRSFANPGYEEKSNRQSYCTFEDLARFGKWVDTFKFDNLDYDLKLTYKDFV